MSDNGNDIALRARAAAYEAEAEACRVSVNRLVYELRVARAESRIALARLDAIARKSRNVAPHCRDELGRMALVDIGIIAEGAERAVSLLRSDCRAA